MLNVPWKKGDTLLYYGQHRVTVVSVNRNSVVVRDGKVIFATDPCFLSAVPPSRNSPEVSGTAVPKRGGAAKERPREPK